jgi:lysozyme
LEEIMDWILKLIELFLKKPADEPALETEKTEEKPNENKDLAPVSEPEKVEEPGIRRISAEGLALIKRFEGLRLTAYYDSVGVLTIGYGSTGTHVSEGMTISEEEAEALLKKDLDRFEKGVASLVTVHLTDNQFAALVAFSFNVGLGNLKSSTLLKKLNAGDYAGASAEFPRWNKAGGVVLLGLTRRRNAEKDLFLGVA